MTNIYLDIDGVLLANEKQKANYSDEFIKYVVSRFPTYWLTTHCRNNENYTMDLLCNFFPTNILEYLKQIKPTNWNINKTEAINFNVPFLWFDDDLYSEEQNDLVKHNVLENWIEVNLSKNQNALGRLLASFPIPIQLLKIKSK